jgi:hypothetical protein
MRSTLILGSAALFLQADARVWGYIDTSSSQLPAVLKQSYDFIVVRCIFLVLAREKKGERS